MIGRDAACSTRFPYGKMNMCVERTNNNVHTRLLRLVEVLSKETGVDKQLVEVWDEVLG